MFARFLAVVLFVVAMCVATQAEARPCVLRKVGKGVGAVLTRVNQARPHLAARVVEARRCR